MDVVEDVVVATAYRRYAQAYAARDAHATAEARYQLSVALLKAGWHPPQVVLDQLERDRRQLDLDRVIQLPE